MALSSGEVPAQDRASALLGQIAARDESALGEFYDLTSRQVYGMVLRLVRDAAAAEEISLEVYLQVWRLAPQFDSSRGTPGAWLMTLARSRAIDWLRSAQTRRSQQSTPLHLGPELTDPGRSPELAYAEATRAAAVRESLDGLPSEQRELIELAYFSGCSHSEIAEQTGLPLGTVKSRIRSGMLHLRETLRPHAGGAQ